MVNTFYILSQSYSENKGSFTRFIETLAKYAYKNQYNVVIITRQLDTNELKFEKYPYAEVKRFKTWDFCLFNSIFTEIIFAVQVKSFFKKIALTKEDIVFANGFTPLGILNKRYFVRAPDQPAFTLLENLEIAKDQVNIFSRIARFFHYFFCSFFDRLVIRNAIGIIYSSSANREEFIKKYGRQGMPFFIPNKSVDIEKRSKIKIDGQKILFIAQNNEKIRKGTIYLERAIPDIFTKYPKAKIIHIGDNISWNVPEWCKKRIISTGRISYDKIKSYYVTADIFLICSISEGIPAVLLEAMASGTPVISSDLIGIDEYITHLKDGYIYKTGDIEELKKGISYMLDRPFQRRSMAIKAREKIKKLDYDIYFKRLFSFLTQINKNKKTSCNLLE